MFKILQWASPEIAIHNQTHVRRYRLDTMVHYHDDLVAEALTQTSPTTAAG